MPQQQLLTVKLSGEDVHMSATSLWAIRVSNGLSRQPTDVTLPNQLPKTVWLGQPRVPGRSQI